MISIFRGLYGSKIYISVPELSTKSVCLEAFKYGWKILIEKPVGYNLKEAKEIFEFSLKTESTVYVALNRRHYSSTLNLIIRIRPHFKS